MQEFMIVISLKLHPVTDKCIVFTCVGIRAFYTALYNAQYVISATRGPSIETMKTKDIV